MREPTQRVVANCRSHDQTAGVLLHKCRSFTTNVDFHDWTFTIRYFSTTGDPSHIMIPMIPTRKPYIYSTNRRINRRHA